MGAESAVVRLAWAQHGVFHRLQARARGMSPRMIGNRLAEGRWMEVHPAVYAIAGVPLTWHGRAKAAELWAYPDGALSHRGSARLLGLEGLRHQALEVSCLRGIRSPGPILHRPRRLPLSQLTVVDGIRTTNAARTLLDLCAVARPWEAEAALDSALRKGLVTERDLREVLGAEARRGRNGIRRFRSLLGDRALDLGVAGSVLASDFRSWMRRNGYPPLVAEYRVIIGDGWIFDLDFAYPQWYVGFEVEGYDPHGNRWAFDRDRDRRNLIESAGWVIVHVTRSSLIRDRALRHSIDEILRTRRPA